MIKKVGFVGIGAMGAPMAKNLHRKGFDVVVCDVSKSALEPFENDGVKTTTTAADCSDTDAVIVMVATLDQIRHVVFGPKGLLSGETRPRYVVVMGTVLPAAIHALAEELLKQGVRLIDAPVSGGIVKAIDGTLTIIVGSEPADCEAVRPMFDAMGSAVFHCGDVGSGQVTKIINNVVCIANMMISAEAYRIGLDNGLKLENFIPVMEMGTGRNFFTRNVDDAPEAYGAWAPTKKDFDAIQSIIRKDIGLGREIGSRSGALPTIDALHDVLANVDESSFETWRRVIEAHSRDTATAAVG